MQIKAVKADITTLDVDAVVDAADSSLPGGGGVDYSDADPSLCRERLAAAG